MKNVTETKVPFLEKKKEAVNRLKAMRYFGKSKEEFRRSGKVMINEPPFGGHFYVDDDEELVSKIKEFENEGKLVYAVVRSKFDGGLMDSLLYVEDERDEWPYFYDDLRNGTTFCYTFNRSFPNFSEYGSIGIMLGAGAGLLRTA